jgi:hypothetical protein
MPNDEHPQRRRRVRIVLPAPDCAGRGGGAAVARRAQRPVPRAFAMRRDRIFDAAIFLRSRAARPFCGPSIVRRGRRVARATVRLAAPPRGLFFVIRIARRGIALVVRWIVWHGRDYSAGEGFVSRAGRAISRAGGCASRETPAPERSRAASSARSRSGWRRPVRLRAGRSRRWKAATGSYRPGGRDTHPTLP